MKKILTLAMAVMFPVISMAASGIPKTNTATVDVDKVTGNYSSFRWVWPGYSKQSCTFTFMQGSSYIDLTGYTGNFKVIKKTNAGQTAYISLTGSDVTISGSNATFSVLYTNIPPDGEYMAEFWAYLTATPATARTLAQGKIVAIDSIYAHDDSSYPWPSNQDTFANYVLLTDDNYENAVTGLTESAGAVFDLSAASRIGTLTYPSTVVTSLVGDTEFVVAGSGHSWTGSIASTLTRDTELVAATQAIGTAYAAADVTALGVATNSFLGIGTTLSDIFSTSNNTFWATNYINNTTWYGGGGSGKAAGQWYVDDNGSVHFYAPDSGVAIDYLYLGGAYGGVGNALALSHYDAWFRRDVTVTQDLYVVGTIYGTSTNATALGGRTESAISNSLAGAFAPKTQTWPMDCNTTLLPTNVVPWVVTSWGPFDVDVTLTKLYAKVMFGSETAMVHVCEMATNAATYTTNNSITADANGVYDTSFADATLGAGNTLFFMLDSTAYSPLASNINVHIDGTRQYVNP